MSKWIVLNTKKHARTHEHITSTYTKKERNKNKGEQTRGHTQISILKSISDAEWLICHFIAL